MDGLIQTPRPLRGAFRVAGVHEGRSRAGGRFLRLSLSRGQRTLDAYAFPGGCRGYRRVRRGEHIRVRGELRQRDGRLELLCQEIAPEDTAPRVAWARVRIRVMLAWMEHVPMRRFLRGVFGDPGIGPAFAERPASVAHHHAFRGGLLVHSVEVAWRIFREPLTPDDKALAVAAALLHDVAKVRTLDADGRRAPLAEGIEHDALTLEVLAPYLAALDAEWPRGAARLRLLLTWRRRADAPRPPDPLIELVRTADRLSADFDPCGGADAGGEVRPPRPHAQPAASSQTRRAA